MTFSWRFIHMWQRNRDVFLRLWHLEAPGFLAEPIIVILAMGFGLGSFVGMIGDEKYVEFIVPGVVASYSMFSAAFECTYGTFYRLQSRKIFDAIIATPLNAEDVIAGEIFWAASRAVVTGSAVLALAAILGFVHSPWAILVPAVSFLEGLMFGSIAMLFTSFAPTFYSFNYFYTLFVTPMSFFAGVFFPLSRFSETVQVLSWIAPLTPAVHLSRALVQGKFDLSTLLALGLIVALTAIAFSISLVTMKRRMTM